MLQSRIGMEVQVKTAVTVGMQRLRRIFVSVPVARPTFATNVLTAVTLAAIPSAATVTKRAPVAMKTSAHTAFGRVTSVVKACAPTVLTTKGATTVKKRKMKKKQATPKLRFTPMAWAKLLFLRDYGDTEVGAFGICPNHPLLVEDIQLVQQRCTWATVAFNDESVADMFEDRVTGGLRPDQFARIWIHTHPGRCANPSFTDENTFERVFGSVDWAVMFIMACGGECYARMRSAGELDADSQEALLDVEVDYSAPIFGHRFRGVGG